MQYFAQVKSSVNWDQDETIQDNLVSDAERTGKITIEKFVSSLHQMCN